MHMLPCVGLKSTNDNPAFFFDVDKQQRAPSGLPAGALLFRVLLQFRHTQAVKVAVSEYGNGLVISQAEFNFRCISGMQDLALAAVFSLKIHPLDRVLRDHRMRSGANGDMDDTVLDAYNGQMLFAACFHGVGHKRFHFLTAADKRNARVMDHTNQVTAVAADLKPCFHHISSFRWFRSGLIATKYIHYLMHLVLIRQDDTRIFLKTAALRTAST